MTLVLEKIEFVENEKILVGDLDLTGKYSYSIF